MRRWIETRLVRLTVDVCIIASSMGWRNESRSLWTICDFQGEHGWQARKSDNKWGAGMRGGKHMAWQWPIQRWKKVWGYDYSFWFNTRTWQTAGWTDRNRTTVQARPTHRAEKQELSYRKQITRQLCTQYVEGIHRPKYYTVTLKSRLRVTQGHWKRNHWADHTRRTISRVIWC